MDTNGGRVNGEGGGQCSIEKLDRKGGRGSAGRAYTVPSCDPAVVPLLIPVSPLPLSPTSPLDRCCAPRASLLFYEGLCGFRTRVYPTRRALATCSSAKPQRVARG